MEKRERKKIKHSSVGFYLCVKIIIIYAIYVHNIVVFK